MEPKIERGQPLRGMRILIVDDEFLIALSLEETFRDAGAEIVSALTLNAALTIAQKDALTAAVLDVRMGQRTTEMVADVLAERGVPFIFYSGQSLPQSMRDKFPEAKVLAKPANQDAFIAVLVAAAQA
ncbi:MAG TPA: response regulator [Beijerinckiaceae bacterium]|nr:response regulator [Beijerinckiaceae bacterium]